MPRLNSCWLLLALGLMSSSALAQSYQINWHTVDGGGVMSSTGGSFTLSGTAGQPDAAAPQSGGNFTLHGGFWVKGLVNDPPVAQDDTFTTLEDTQLNDDVLADNGNGADSDPDNDPLAVNTTPVSGPSNGALTLNADGSFTYTPNTNFNGTDTFDYEVCDDSGIPTNCDTATVTINVGAANDAPVAFDDGFATPEETPLGGNVLSDNGSGADSDPESDPLTVNTTPVSGPSNGALTLNADGSFTYTPNADFNGTDQFDYEVLDGNGGTDQATVTITVGAVNDPPAANDDNYAVTQDTALNVNAAGGVLANDSDSDGPSLSATLVTGPSNAQSFVLNADGSFDYVPSPGFVDTDSFVYEANDGAGGTAQATATITVSATPVSTVLVQIAGNGQGQVTSNPTGIACPGDCSQVFDQGITVVLTATPDADNFFTGWDNCPSPNGNQCTFTVGSAPITVGANFQVDVLAQVQPIPVLGWWALMMLSGLIMLMGAWGVRRG